MAGDRIPAIFDEIRFEREQLERPLIQMTRRFSHSFIRHVSPF
jgi:hypothetical protein